MRTQTLTWYKISEKKPEENRPLLVLKSWQCIPVHEEFYTNTKSCYWKAYGDEVRNTDRWAYFDFRSEDLEETDLAEPVHRRRIKFKPGDIIITPKKY